MIQDRAARWEEEKDGNVAVRILDQEGSWMLFVLCGLTRVVGEQQ